MRSDIFLKIKRLVMQRQVVFTKKAENEIAASNLTRELVYESIWGAPGIHKVLRSRNPRSGKRETLYVIHGITLDGLALYTKGKIEKVGKKEFFYVFISTKKLD